MMNFSIELLSTVRYGVKIDELVKNDTSYCAIAYSTLI